MSLSESVLEIADEMERSAQNAEGAKSLFEDMIQYAKQLRRVVKASQSAQAPAPSAFDYARLAQLPPQKIGTRKNELSEEKYEAATGGNMQVVHGGLSDGDTISIDPNAPVGAFVVLEGGQFYVKRSNGEWHFDPDKAARLKGVA